MNRLTRALILALVVTACGDISDAPELRPQRFVARLGETPPIAKYRSGAPQLIIAFAIAQIGPAGGKFSFAGFDVSVPAGAVSKRTTFSIRLPIDPSLSQYVYAEFGPHGVKFDQPITLTLPYKGTTTEGEPSHVVWYDGQKWVELPSLITADGRIQTQTNHFSEYGTEELAPAKGITQINTRPRAGR
ncbi:MAG TPA: hypothetical protein VM100_08585 [Longimicrobiales bacterium]|nr:hypothetical protein [Longimicrobiales bacterium]